MLSNTNTSLGHISGHVSLVPREDRPVGWPRGRPATAEQAAEFWGRVRANPPPPPPVEEEEEEEETWPPVWKPLEESPQFRCGLLQSYLRFEESLKSHDFTKPPLNNDHNRNILRFLKQVRESRGFDLDDCPDEFKKGFPLMETHSILKDDPPYSRVFDQKKNFVVAKINAQAEMHGEKYEYHHGFEKVADSWSQRLSLLTISVKKVAPEAEAGQIKVVQAMVFDALGGHFKLKGWRFKPE